VNGDVQLVEDLVAKFPDLEDSYNSHVFNEGEVLPHVFFWDVTQDVINSFASRSGGPLDWQSILDFLEDWLRRGIPEASELICTSFLCYLPHPGSPGCEIVNHLGPVMARSFREVRPYG
jgi:hypothetical protein